MKQLRCYQLAVNNILFFKIFILISTLTIIGTEMYNKGIFRPNFIEIIPRRMLPTRWLICKNDKYEALLCEKYSIYSCRLHDWKILNPNAYKFTAISELKKKYQFTRQNTNLMYRCQCLPINVAKYWFFPFCSPIVIKKL